MEEKDERWYKTLPMFDGEDPFGWLFRVEKHFLVNSIADDEKLEVAVACLVGKALNWCIWLETRARIQSWSEFKREVTKRFHELFSAKQDLSKENEEKQSAEAEEKLEMKMEVENAVISEKEEKKPAEQEEEKKEPTAEQQLKLSPFVT